MKLTVKRTEVVTVRATTKQVGRSRGDVTRSLENGCELRKKTNRWLTVTCKFSPFPKSAFTRILKTIVKQLKKFFVRLLLWLHFPITH